MTDATLGSGYDAEMTSCNNQLTLCQQSPGYSRRGSSRPPVHQVREHRDGAQQPGELKLVRFASNGEWRVLAGGTANVNNR